ncbi:hypothetical protein NJB25_13035 [Escherichia fergusonii]|uniref:hypothetical protein n=1 Tax=Escherichia fergusonii TaxID=564 RepID=UPI001CBE3055|nr:hypothetical protein [Escherichia fergusonii]MCO7826038.1 hypothetical protein [Escherichia fergusonii]MCO7835107.1 hypothetical protein [Escherichia fergusonii]MCO7914973.1 hypothetical protein [Escherichia fergusonii]BED94688.1 hypothetical protein Ef30038_11120 [Escherichia fergusonii]BES12414.1 hypothetical protein Ef18B226LT_09930 [Escherichia fergusonii]
MNKISQAILSIIICITTISTIAHAKALTLPLDSTKITPLAIYYKNITNGITELSLSETQKSQTTPFNQQEITIPVKGDNFLSPWIAKDTRFYELGQFEDKDNICRLVMYNTIGESDTPLLNVQLNTYNRKGILLDALLLSTFFGYEDIIRFSHFTINPDYTIAIDNYIIYPYESGEYGTTPHKKNPKPEVYIRAKYKIVKGYFKLTFREEYKTN